MKETGEANLRRSCVAWTTTAKEARILERSVHADPGKPKDSDHDTVD